MTVYLVTLVSVIILGSFAQAVDYKHVPQEEKLCIRHTRSAGFYYFLATIILALVAGLRYKVGTDYSAYYYGFRVFANDLGKSIIAIDEPGYPLIAKVATVLHGDGATALFIASLLTILPALRVIYWHTNKLVLALVLFVFLGFWHGSFNGVRQYLAATMLFCGYDSLINRQFKKYLFYVFLAFLFHRSVVVMIVLYFVVYRKITTRNLLVLFISTFFVYFFYGQVLSIAGWITDSTYTLDDEYAAHAVNIIRVFASCAPAVVFLGIFWDKPKDAQTSLFLNMLIIHAAIRVATMSSALLYRVGSYTTLFQIIAIPELLKRTRPRMRRVITIIMIPLFAFFWWYEINRNGGASNFHWIWQR